MQVINNQVYPENNDVEVLESCFEKTFPIERDVLTVRVWIQKNVERLKAEGGGQHLLAEICEKMLDQLPSPSIT